MMTPFRFSLFRKVAVVGVGLMGGSLAKAIKKHRLAREVVGMSRRQSTLTAALQEKAIDKGFHDVKKAVANADLVVLATPVSIINNMLSTMGPFLKRNCIVTDVGSTKASIVHIAEKKLPKHVHFVGSHPLTGSEKKGIQNADVDLYKDAFCILTPTDQTNKSACEKVKRLWTKVGARIKILTPDEHDRILSYISHLPHVLAYALIETIPKDCLEYAATGLKDTTRIASSSPQVWNDICIGNSKNIIHSLDELVKNLSLIRKAIVTDNQKVLVGHFKTAKNKRDKFLPDE